MHHDRRGMAPALPEFGAKPWVINFNAPMEQATETLLNPFDGSSHHVDLPMVEGTTCLRCFGTWSLMLHDETKDCFLFDLASLSTIPLPPLLEPLPEWPRPGCALSSPATIPDCTVIVVTEDDAEFLLYCRPGDKEWSKFFPEHDTLLRPMHGSDGRIYATSGLDWELLVIDVDSAAGVHVVKDEKVAAYVSVPCAYKLCPVNGDYLSQWVESGDGEIFLVRFQWYGYESTVLRDVDVHRFDASSRRFELVESIGDRTIFSTVESVVVSKASEAGTQPDCIHFLYVCRTDDDLRLYTIRLRDRTVTTSLVPIRTIGVLHWVIPQSFRLEPPKSLCVSTVEPVAAGALSSKFSRSLTLDDENTNEDAVPWSTLHIDYIELLVPKCCLRYWSKITRPIQDANPYPMLLSICSNSGDKYHLFDPMTSKEYDLNQGEGLFHGEKLVVLFSKCGWVLITEGTGSVTALNPFTKEAFELPPTEVSVFHGISFSSAPASPDSVVLMVEKWRNDDHVNVFVWHAGDEDWTCLDFDLEPDAKFKLTYSNPVFLENKFYCLGCHGNLAVFSLSDMEWKVLNKPECIYKDDDLRCEIDRAHLLEFRGELIAVFVPHHKAPIEMFKLDKGQMAWTKLERLDDATMFVDNWGVTLIPQPNANLCNRKTTLGDKIIAHASSRFIREAQTEDFKTMSDYGADYNYKEDESEDVEEDRDDEDEDEEEHANDEDEAEESKS